ncbi:MAG: 16S rRNA (adenine(1518)-N(6)/adenine(1519)-N(6))-dimethyltransferase RsmA [Oscillospiraceae bacterium]|nr:16S rRNA (adenine(1518)-N(6)/adenine(1519)-N(6))-dimethyltransferase RsmA [Oscillospiraceae bacterium]
MYKAKKYFGQNFLTDPKIADKIAETSGADRDCGVIEIGAGRGILTAALARCAAKVISLEIDRELLPELVENLKEYDNIEIINADARKADYAALCALFKTGEKSLRLILCANLPYNITTPLLAAILEADCFERVTVMIQREVAQRLCAEAGTPDYGAFSLFVQNRAEVKTAFTVPPGCFTPAPKVTSAVVTLERIPMRCTHPMFERVVRAAFAQRRKQLVNALSAGLSLNRSAITEVLTSAGIDPQARGETLTLEDFARICEGLEK